MDPAFFLHLWKPALEIFILWFVIYHIMLFFEGTRAIQVLRGIIILLLAFFLIQRLDLEILDWLFTKLFAISVIATLIIFHPEIRRGLELLGQRHIFGTAMREEEIDYMLNQLGKAAEHLSKSKAGALIAIEKTDSLNLYIESGVQIDARLSSELIETVFTPNSLLHDGGLVIQHGRIVAAGCLFPFTQNPHLSRMYGMRHRAALGLSEETDAVIIIVSEERQDVSLVHEGKLYRDVSREETMVKIKELLKLKKEDAETQEKA